MRTMILNEESDRRDDGVMVATSMCNGGRAMRRCFFVLACFVLALVPVAAATAGWNTGGVPLCDSCAASDGSAGGTIQMSSVADGTGGAIVTWTNLGTIASDIRAQRVDAAGRVRWGRSGLTICSATENQDQPVIVSDGSGGAIIAWLDHRASADGDIYAQRVDSSGVLRWTSGGLSICSAAGMQAELGLVSGGAGDAYFVWRDQRLSPSRSDIRAQRVNAVGAPLWQADGIVVSDTTGSPSSPRAITDGAGGVIVCWGDYRSGTAVLYAQRLALTGAAQWTGNGKSLGIAAHSARICADGSGGAFLVWTNWLSSRIWGQRLGSTGDLLWTSGDVDLGTSNVGVWMCTLDGQGGLLVAWPLSGSAGTRPVWTQGVSAQHVTGAGQLLWGANGTLVSNVSGARERLWTILPDGQGGGVFVWDDGREAGVRGVFAQRLDSPGSAMWNPDPAQICGVAGTQTGGTAVRTSAGIVAAWVDTRPGGTPGPRVFARILPATTFPFIALAWSAGGRIETITDTPFVQDSLWAGPLDEVVFKPVPDQGYYVNEVTLDGGSLGVVPNVDLSHPTSDHTVYAGFSNTIWPEPAVTTPTRAYATMTFPLTFANDSVRSVLGELGPYDDTAWRLARWNPDSAAYQFAGQGFHRIEAGAGYWLITAGGEQVQADGTPLTADTVGVRLRGTASSGWNQIGNPFRFPVADTALRVLGPGGLVGFTSGGNTVTDPLIWEWKGGANYDSVRTIQPRKAYWVRKSVSAPVNLVFPNWSSQVVTPGPATLPANAEWVVALSARQGETSSMRVLAGRWSRTAQSAALRLEAPPGSPDGGLSLRLGEVGSGTAGRIADFAQDDGPWAWELELRGAEAPGEVTLECEAGNLPAGLRLWLSDETRDWSQELRPGEPVTLAAAGGVRCLRLHAALGGDIPVGPSAGAGFSAAYPNPFRTQVGLVFRLARPTSVRVDIYDLQGRRVRGLEAGVLAAGERVVLWNGKDDAGNDAPGGVYFARGTVAGIQSTRRLLRLGVGR